LCTFFYHKYQVLLTICIYSKFSLIDLVEMVNTSLHMYNNLLILFSESSRYDNKYLYLVQKESSANIDEHQEGLICTSAVKNIWCCPWYSQHIFYKLE